MQIPIISRRGTTKPWPSIPRINWAHPLAQGLDFYCYFTPSIKQIDLVKGRWSTVPVTSGGWKSQTNPYGLGLRQGWPVASGTTKCAFQWTDGPATFSSDGAGNGDYTLALASTLNALGNPGSSSDWMAQQDTIAAAGCGVDSFIDNPTGVVHPDFWTWSVSFGGTVGATNPAITIGAYNTFVNSRKGTTGTGYMNGVAVCADTTTDTVAGANSFIDIGVPETPGGTGIGASLDFTAMYFAAWRRALTPAETLQLHLDPYCFLIFPEDEIFATLVGAAAATAALFASTRLALSGRAQLSGSVPLAARAGAQLKGSAAPSGKAALSARTTLAARGKAGATYVAHLAATTLLAAKGTASPTGKVGFAARSMVALAGRLAPAGTAAVLALFASGFVRLTGRAGITGAVPLQAKTLAQLTGTAQPSGKVGLAARTMSALKGQAGITGSVRLAATTLVASFGRAAIVGKAALSASTTMAMKARASATGTVGLAARTLVAFTGILLPAGTRPIKQLAARTMLALRSTAVMQLFLRSERSAKVPGSNRSAAVPGRKRSANVPASNRSAIVIGSDRVAKVPGGNDG